MPLLKFQPSYFEFQKFLVFESQDIPKCRFDFIEDLKALETPRKFVLRFGYVFQMSYFVTLPTAFMQN